jgi:hypothetical protein
MQNSSLKELLRKRLHVSYTRKLFKTVPEDLVPILKKIFLYGFKDKPNYEEVRNVFR